MQLTRTHCIAITAYLPNLLSPTTLYGIIRTQDERMAGRHKGRYQQTQQDTTPLAGARLHPIQHLVKVGESEFLRPPHHPQHRGHRAFSRGQNGADQQQLSMGPYSLRKQWRKNGDKAYYICHERLPPRVDLRMPESLNLTLGQGSRFVG